jgi:plastocyanin
MLDGADLNGNGAIEPIPGEGGAFTLYFHSQYLATVGATAREGSGITVPAVQPTAEPTATAQPTVAGSTVVAPAATSTTAANQPTPTSVPATPTTAAALEPVFITYSDFVITPGQNTAKVGQPIIFLIQGSLHQPYAGAAAPFIFEAPNNLGNGTQFQITFNNAQTLTILCGFHGGMQATLTITP